jgi:hypothetical protein
MQGTVLRALAAANPAATAAGATDFEEAEVDSWLDFAANELSAHTAVAAPHALTFGALGRLDGTLASRTFLVGETFLRARSKPVPTRVVETHIDTVKKYVPQMSKRSPLGACVCLLVLVLSVASILWVSHQAIASRWLTWPFAQQSPTAAAPVPLFRTCAAG